MYAQPTDWAGTLTMFGGLVVSAAAAVVWFG